MASVLRASFVRIQGQRDRIYVHRSNETETSWVFPTYGDRLPHDLVHLVVESAFGLRYGFWGRVDAGADPARVNDEANRTGGADKYRGFGEDRREILLAESLAAASWSDPETSDAALASAVAASCAQLDVALAVSITAERAAQTREALRRLEARWRALGAKGTIALSFRPDAPERSFAELLAG